MNIIDQLKKNEKPFGLMSEEMQEEANEIGLFDNFRVFVSRNWGGINKAPGSIFSGESTYRLRPDYAEEPEIEECKITIGESMAWKGKLIYVDEEALEQGLCEAIECPNFIGFKFADGTVSGSPVKYSVPGITVRGYYASYDDIKTKQALEHHATHVLFLKGE